MKMRHLTILYEIIMIILVVVSLSTILSPNPKLSQLHNITWVIFLTDVTVRFFRTRKKWSYVKGNPFDIISIIPLEDMFLLARFSRFLRLFRYKNVIKRYLDRIDNILKNINFINLTYIVIVLNVTVAIILSLVTNITMLNSFKWTLLNFFKFNYQSENNHHLALSIGLKVVGVLYMGLLLNKALNIGRIHFDKFRDGYKRE